MSSPFFRKDHAADDAGAAAQSRRKTAKEPVESAWSEIGPRIVPPMVLWMAILANSSPAEGVARFGDSLAYVWTMIAG